MPKISLLNETLYLRLSTEDKEWIEDRSKALALQPTIYARLLLRKAVELDKQSPGKVFTGAL